MNLTRRERLLAGATGCLLCVLACAIAPRNAAALMFPRGAAPEPPVAIDPHEDERHPVTIVRDPFVADGSAVRSVTVPADGGSFAPIAGVPVLPPNGAIAGQAVPRKETESVIRAIVTGERPSAIVILAGETLLVRPGDRLLGKRIQAIDIDGILLDGNVRLPFPP